MRITTERQRSQRCLCALCAFVVNHRSRSSGGRRIATGTTTARKTMLQKIAPCQSSNRRERVSRSSPSMSAPFVKSKTVTSSLSGCFSNRLSRTAAGARRFTFCRNRTGSIDSSPLSIPLKKNETIQQQKMMKPIIMPQHCFDPMFLECRCRLFSPAELPRSFYARRAAR